MADAPGGTHGDPSTAGPHLFSEDQAKAFLGLIRAGSALESALDSGLVNEHDIGLHEFEVLLFLATSSPDTGLPMTHLRRRTPLSQSRLSRVVSGLEAKGLVRRATDPADSRAVIVSLTPEGKSTFDAARPRHQRDLDDYLFSILTATEIRHLADITSKLLAAQQYRR